MAPRAQVKSVDAIDAFRAALVVYASQARAALDEVSADAQRTRTWLENDQRLVWERELRRRLRALEQAQQELFSARLSNWQTDSDLRRMMEQRARRSVEQAQEKLRLLQRWSRDFEGRAQPLVKETEKLHTLLSHDLVQAAAYLRDVVRTLSAYAEIQPPAAPAPPADAPPGGDA